MHQGAHVNLLRQGPGLQGPDLFVVRVLLQDLGALLYTVIVPVRENSIQVKTLSSILTIMSSPVSSVETECHEDRVHARNVSHHRHDVLCEILTERMCCDIDSHPT